MPGDGLGTVIEAFAGQFGPQRQNQFDGGFW